MALDMNAAAGAPAALRPPPPRPAAGSRSRRMCLLAALLAVAGCAAPGEWTPGQRAQLTEWTLAVRETIRSRMYFPRDPGVATPLEAGTAMVRITVDGNGAIYTPQIARSSGYPLFDAAALAIVLSAAPFPPPPAFLVEREGTTTVSLPVRFVPPGARP